MTLSIFLLVKVLIHKILLDPKSIDKTYKASNDTKRRNFKIIASVLYHFIKIFIIENLSYLPINQNHLSQEFRCKPITFPLSFNEDEIY